MSETKLWGEFKCKECGKIFFQKKLLDCHLGVHGRNKTGTPKCKKCGSVLNDKNWHKSLQKNQNRMCRLCVRVRNRTSYLNKKKRIMAERKGK